MRKTSPLAVALISMAVTSMAAAFGTTALPPARADPSSALGPVARRLVQARQAREAAVEEMNLAESRFQALDQEYRAVQADIEQATRDVVRALLEQRAVSQRLAEAQQALDHRAAAAYMAGPGFGFELFLGSRTPSGYLAAREAAARTLSVDRATVDRMRRDGLALSQLAGRLLARQSALRGSAARLQDLDARMAEQLGRAQAAARRAGLTVRKLVEQKRALEKARAEAQARLRLLVDPTRGVDQSALLSLLGPNRGRGCDIPPGLKDTDTHLSGLASWYGWGAAGGPTSSGAIFDPRLFTAANKELPLNVFLRVHLGDRCAIVLVNDHGPYGMGRSFDLSQAAAQYLGYESAGVVHVTADVLVPVVPPAPVVRVSPSSSPPG